MHLLDFTKLNSSALEKHGVRNSKWTLRRRGPDLNVQWTLSGELLNMSTVPKLKFDCNSVSHQPGV